VSLNRIFAEAAPNAVFSIVCNGLILQPKGAYKAIAHILSGVRHYAPRRLPEITFGRTPTVWSVKAGISYRPALGMHALSDVTCPLLRGHPRFRRLRLIFSVITRIGVVGNILGNSVP
jgi:hypothetical protein